MFLLIDISESLLKKQVEKCHALGVIFFTIDFEIPLQQTIN